MRERKKNTDLLLHLLCTHWLILVCALIRDGTTTLVNWDDALTELPGQGLPEAFTSLGFGLLT